MILDWFAREGGIVLSWWALTTLAGLAVLPLCMRVLSGLPDRGYTLSRAAGLLLTGFTFWLMASVGLLRNTPGSITLAWLMMLVISLVVYSRRPIDLREWWRENSRVVIASEILFFVLLLGWALVRAHLPNLTGTEKPMELAFMSATQRSATFPPNDPWMSGYAISYYYFGYVISAMLSSMSGVWSTVGFNMTISLLFALTGLGAFGVTYNLVRSRAYRAGELLETGSPSRWSALGVGMLGMVFVVLLGNYQAPLIELPFQSRMASAEYLAFFDTQERATYTADTSGIADPTQWGYWWWFRASRVIQDRNLDGTPIGVQPIDEFPAFSFLLADNHPHVLALPFAMLGLGVAFHVLLAGRGAGAVDIVFYGLFIGGMIFLNTWDGPIYLGALLGAEALRRMSYDGSGRLSGRDVRRIAAMGAGLLAVALIAYLPFFISFRSQASGVLPNVLHPTSLPQMFIMFGPFLLVLPFFLAVEAWRSGWRMNWKLGIQFAGGILLVLLLVLIVFVIAGALNPEIRGAALSFIGAESTPEGVQSALGAVLVRRLVLLPVTLLLLLGVMMVVGRLIPRLTAPARLKMDEVSEDEPYLVVTYSPATGFALLLTAIALLLVLIPDFLYLRDNFGVRINTVFKFYYQAWLLMAIASAYAVYAVLNDVALRRPALVLRGAFGMTAMAAVALGLFYPVFGIHNRMFLESGRDGVQEPPPLTLDGGPTLVFGDDYTAIMCLRALEQSPDAVVAEAIGGAYRAEFGRVAGLTGIPTVMGWENHEQQWRGPTYTAAAGSRVPDITTLYNDLRWEIAQDIINRHQIDYIFYGSSERRTYNAAGEDKFREFLEPVCQSGDSLFYRARPEATEVVVR